MRPPIVRPADYRSAVDIKFNVGAILYKAQLMDGTRLCRNSGMALTHKIEACVLSQIRIWACAIMWRICVIRDMVRVDLTIDILLEAPIPFWQRLIEDIYSVFARSSEKYDAKTGLLVQILSLPLRDEAVWQRFRTPENVVPGFVWGVHLHPAVFETHGALPFHHPVPNMLRAI